MKATVFYNNEHINIIISKPDITPEECKKTSNIFTLPSPCNTSVLEKNNKVNNTDPMTFIYLNKPGLRTRSIFNRVRVRVHKKFASPSSSSLNFNFSSSSSSSQNRVEKIQSE